jgi:hypothetical protein
VAGTQVPRVAAPIALERLAGLVEPPAVGLDDEALLGEEEVALFAGDRVVDLRGRQAVLGAGREEEPFEVAALEGR